MSLDMKPLEDVFKNAPTASSLSGLLMMFVNSLGVPVKMGNTPVIVYSYSGNINDIQTTGFYKLTESATGCPVSNPIGSFLLHLNWDGNAAHQVFFRYPEGYLQPRIKTSGVWKPWKQLAFVTT